MTSGQATGVRAKPRLHQGKWQILRWRRPNHSHCSCSSPSRKTEARSAARQAHATREQINKKKQFTQIDRNIHPGVSIGQRKNGTAHEGSAVLRKLFMVGLNQSCAGARQFPSGPCPVRRRSFHHQEHSSPVDPGQAVRYK